MTKRLLDFDPLTRESVWFEMDDSTGIATLHQEQDVSHIIESNKMMAKDADYSKKGMKADWWHYARVPNNIIHKWMVEDGINFFDKNDRKKVFAKLNDPAYRHLKVTDKKHA